MCIIITKPAGVKMPPKAILDRCAALNPHGFGFATKDRIYKTLSYSDFYNALKSIRKNEAAILHFRYATHGSIKLENCHPFKDAETGLSFAHNGVLDITPIGDMTDSETAFRTVIMPVVKKHGFDSDEFCITTHNIKGPSRFAFIDKEGKYRLYGPFTQYNGCWYSNRNFLPYTYSKYAYAR